MTIPKVTLSLALLTGMAVQLVPATPPATSDVQFREAIARGNEAKFVPVVRHYPRRHYYVVKRRSRAKSAAIVGGSALGGAAIGGLAGGGKGAGIGAIAGGVGGFIYDRKTHKKIVRR